MMDESPFTITLANNPFFDTNLQPIGPLADLCSELWPLVAAHIPASRKRPLGEQYVFGSLIANFCRMLLIGKTELTTPRNHDFLKSGSRYRPRKATYHAVTRTLDACVAAGLIEQDIGSGQHKVTSNVHGDLRCVREATRVRPSDYLSDQLRPFLIHEVHRLARWDENAEVIHLRDKVIGDGKSGKSEQVEYEDTPETISFRSQVRRINQHLRAHPCHYSGQRKVNLLDDHVVRIFNSGSWGQGGRLYGYWPMNLPSSERHHLSIDGEPLSDLDFGSCFVALLHVYDGSQFDPLAPDPFRIEGHEEHRNLIKKCAYAILNAKKAITRYPEDVADGNQINLPPWPIVERLIFDHVPLFRRYAYTGLGLTLMRKESDILISILLDLVERGIGFIPMHDGIMVPTSKRALTEMLMLTHYHAQTGQMISIKEKTIGRPSLGVSDSSQEVCAA